VNPQPLPDGRSAWLDGEKISNQILLGEKWAKSQQTFQSDWFCVYSPELDH